MIDSPEKLVSTIRLQFRFLKSASADLGFKSNRDYQRFRNTILGASRDYQVIAALVKKYPKLDTKSIWGLDRDLLKNAQVNANK